MSTLFDNSSLPLWLWITIIVVGSLCLIGAIGVIILCMVRRNRSGGSVAEVPVRKMTVRRGRVVPASHYLSLTGSKFGLNQFDEDRANGARSKSPFEWWNTIKEKRRSHHEDDHYLEASPESKSRLNLHYTSQDYPRSPTYDSAEKDPTTVVHEVHPSPEKPARIASFSRPFAGAVHYQEQPSTDWASNAHARNLSMIKESSPHNSVILARTLERRSSRLSGYNPGDSTRRERRPSNHQNDSQRSGNDQIDSRRPSQHSERHSSQRSERRPSQHTERRHRQHSEQNPHQHSDPRQPAHQSDSRRPSYQSDSRQPYEPRSQSSRTSGRSRRTSDAPSDGRRPSGGSLRPSPASSRRTSDRSGSSRHRPTMPTSTHPVPPPESAQVPRPIAYRGSRHSLGEEAMSSNSTLSKRGSVGSRLDSLTDYTDLTRRLSRPQSLVLGDAPSQDAGYYASRAEMMPTALPQQPPTPTTPTGPSRASSIGTSNGRKGNVLRKKSIKRQEVLSYVGA